MMVIIIIPAISTIGECRAVSIYVSLGLSPSFPIPDPPECSLCGIFKITRQQNQDKPAGEHHLILSEGFIYWFSQQQ